MVRWRRGSIGDSAKLSFHHTEKRSGQVPEPDLENEIYDIEIFK